MCVPYDVLPGSTDPLDYIVERQFDEDILALRLLCGLAKILSFLYHGGIRGGHPLHIVHLGVCRGDLSSNGIHRIQ